MYTIYIYKKKHTHFCQNCARTVHRTKNTLVSKLVPGLKMQKDEQMFKGERLAGDAIKRLREVCALPITTKASTNILSKRANISHSWDVNAGK